MNGHSMMSASCPIHPQYPHHEHWSAALAPTILYGASDTGVPSPLEQ